MTMGSHGRVHSARPAVQRKIAPPVPKAKAKNHPAGIPTEVQKAIEQRCKALRTSVQEAVEKEIKPTMLGWWKERYWPGEAAKQDDGGDGGDDDDENGDDEDGDEQARRKSPRNKSSRRPSASSGKSARSSKTAGTPKSNGSPKNSGSPKSTGSRRTSGRKTPPPARNSRKIILGMDGRKPDADAAGGEPEDDENDTEPDPDSNHAASDIEDIDHHIYPRKVGGSHHWSLSIPVLYVAVQTPFECMNETSKSGKGRKARKT
ncbi:hypothetical protein EJ08DRAFT_684272 [Tothia fuscella]|uniref:Uncharacterized protein n=1 Tax=Tothia fuscella TaxID=1048955 RepID=A0A9P4TSJ9_9PEZI|nr:hypothetical protein EJ08DRAFT_684272 [Tothia fuscella]